MATLLSRLLYDSQNEVSFCAVSISIYLPSPVTTAATFQFTEITRQTYAEVGT